MYTKFCNWIILVFSISQAFCQETTAMNDSAGSDHVFVVHYVCGAAHTDNTAEILGFSDASSPEKAIKKYVLSSHKNWIIHEDSRTAKYARLENPVSFVSGLINYYSATAASVPKNKAGQMKFNIYTVKSDGIRDDKKFAQCIWADNAGNALKQYLGKDLDKWIITQSSLSTLTNEYFINAVQKEDKGINMNRLIVSVAYIPTNDIE